jgi:hypothetical protein
MRRSFASDPETENSPPADTPAIKKAASKNAVNRLEFTRMFYVTYLDIIAPNGRRLKHEGTFQVRGRCAGKAGIVRYRGLRYLFLQLNATTETRGEK